VLTEMFPYTHAHLGMPAEAGGAATRTNQCPTFCPCTAICAAHENAVSYQGKPGVWRVNRTQRRHMKHQQQADEAEQLDAGVEEEEKRGASGDESEAVEAVGLDDGDEPLEGNDPPSPPPPVEPPRPAPPLEVDFMQQVLTEPARIGQLWGFRLLSETVKTGASEISIRRLTNIMQKTFKKELQGVDLPKTFAQCKQPFLHLIQKEVRSAVCPCDRFIYEGDAAKLSRCPYIDPDDPSETVCNQLKINRTTKRPWRELYTYDIGERVSRLMRNPVIAAAAHALEQKVAARNAMPESTPAEREAKSIISDIYTGEVWKMIDATSRKKLRDAGKMLPDLFIDFAFSWDGIAPFDKSAQVRTCVWLACDNQIAPNPGFYYMQRSHFTRDHINTNLRVAGAWQLMLLQPGLRFVQRSCDHVNAHVVFRITGR
jgi:hypothetical protein